MPSVPPPSGRPDLTMAIRQAMNAYRDGRLDDAALACATVISWGFRTFRRAPPRRRGEARPGRRCRSGEAPHRGGQAQGAVSSRRRTTSAAPCMEPGTMSPPWRSTSGRCRSGRPIRRPTTVSAMRSARSDGWRRRCRAISARCRIGRIMARPSTARGAGAAGPLRPRRGGAGKLHRGPRRRSRLCRSAFQSRQCPACARPPSTRAGEL